VHGDYRKKKSSFHFTKLTAISCNLQQKTECKYQAPADIKSCRTTKHKTAKQYFFDVFEIG
jgi:hypothetical protein